MADSDVYRYGSNITSKWNENWMCYMNHFICSIMFSEWLESIMTVTLDEWASPPVSLSTGGTWTPSRGSVRSQWRRLWAERTSRWPSSAQRTCHTRTVSGTVCLEWILTDVLSTSCSAGGANESFFMDKKNFTPEFFFFTWCLNFSPKISATTNASKSK